GGDPAAGRSRRSGCGHMTGTRVHHLNCAHRPAVTWSAPSVDRGAGAGQGRAMDGVPLDALITRMLARSPFDYRVAATDSEREVAYRLRGSTVLDRGWCTASDLPGGMERDEHDDRAIHVIGWDGDVAMSTGRVVL